MREVSVIVLQTSSVNMTRYSSTIQYTHSNSCAHLNSHLINMEVWIRKLLGNERVTFHYILYTYFKT